MYQENLSVVTLEAGQDLSTRQFCCVTVAADGQIDPTGAGALVDGILQNNPSTVGEAATVALGGISRVLAGGNITTGDLLASDANGRAVTATSGQEIFGKALGPGVNNQVIPVLLKFSGRAPRP
jgi:hypothetical protein